jgi:hypothetical protein
MRRFLFLILPWFWLIAGCQTLGIQTADVPLAVGCAGSVTPRPTWQDNADAIKSASGIEARVRLMIAGRIQRDKRIDDLEGALVACDLPDF